MNKGRYIYICKGCIISVNLNPDKVTESCIAKSPKIACEVCNIIQDSSWFKHMNIVDLPPSLIKG